MAATGPRVNKALDQTPNQITISRHSKLLARRATAAMAAALFVTMPG